MNMIEKLQNNLSKLADLVVRLKTNITILETLRECGQEKESCIDFMNQTVAFWQSIIRSTWGQIIMDLSKIYDYYREDGSKSESIPKNEKETISIPSTILLCEQNKHNLIKTFIKVRTGQEGNSRTSFNSYDEMQSTAKSLLNIDLLHSILKELRNKSFAHLDYKTFFGKKKNTLFLGMDEIKELVRIAEEIIEVYSGALFNKSYDFETQRGKTDTQMLLEYAQEGYRYEMKEAGFEDIDE